MINTRAEIEEMLRDTGFGDERQVTIGAEVTWGQYVVEPRVELSGGRVVDDVPTLTLPQAVPGIRIDALVTIDPEGDFLITERLPATAPGETLLVLRHT